MTFEWFLFLVAICVVKASNVSSHEKKLHPLRCLLEDMFDTLEPCVVFPGTNFQNISSLSAKLVKVYSTLDPNFHNAVNEQNFTFITVEILEKIPDPMLLLFPVNHLSKIKSDHLLNLILQKLDSLVVKHLVKAYLLRNKVEPLINQLQAVELPSRTLTWISDTISDNVNVSQQVLSRPPLLFYSNPFSVLFNNTFEKLFHLSFWEKSNLISKNISDAYLRIWAYAMIRNDFPGSYDNWNDLFLKRWDLLLPASTSDELKLLSQSKISSLQLLFSLGFSSVQVRTLFDEFAERLIASRLDYQTLSNNLIKLLPFQLLYFVEEVHYLEQLKILPSIRSLPTSNQIFELLLYRKTVNDDHVYLNNFSYVLSPNSLSQYVKTYLTAADLMKIQSNHFSKSQLYSLSKAATLFNLTSESIFNCRELITVLPARDIIFNQTASHVLLHLLAHIDARSVPQSFAVLNKLWPELGSPGALKQILENKDSHILLQYLPSRYISQIGENILASIEELNIHMQLPDSFISSLLIHKKLNEKNFTFESIKQHEAFLFNGASCEDIASLDPYDFVIFMSKFVEVRRVSGKSFPKKLQQCCVEKFLEYIELKSRLFQRTLKESKLSLLNQAEIDSIGGYIFSAFPVRSIANSKNTMKIIKCIGKLSLSELILAAPISKLRILGNTLFTHNFKSERKIDYDLFDLGNLTLFLEKRHLPQINATFFKLLLESNYIDHRLCADKSSRDAWFDYIKMCFGETTYWTYQTLVTLGELLIVVPSEELKKIPPKSWIYAADILTFQYHEVIYDLSPLKFYEVCMLQLSYQEAELYLIEIKKLLEAFVDAAQLQLNTVTSIASLEKNDTNNEVFNFIDSSKSNIKILLPSLRNVINTESPLKVETRFEISKIEFPVTIESSSDVMKDNDYAEDLSNSSISQYLLNLSTESISNISVVTDSTELVKESTVPYLFISQGYDVGNSSYFYPSYYYNSTSLENVKSTFDSSVVASREQQMSTLQNNVTFTEVLSEVTQATADKKTVFFNEISVVPFFYTTLLDQSGFSTPTKYENEFPAAKSNLTRGRLPSKENLDFSGDINNFEVFNPEYSKTSEKNPHLTTNITPELYRVSHTNSVTHDTISASISKENGSSSTHYFSGNSNNYALNFDSGNDADNDNAFNNSVTTDSKLYYDPTTEHFTLLEMNNSNRNQISTTTLNYNDSSETFSKSSPSILENHFSYPRINISTTAISNDQIVPNSGESAISKQVDSDPSQMDFMFESSPAEDTMLLSKYINKSKNNNNNVIIKDNASDSNNIENLLNDNGAKTELLNINFSSMNSMFKKIRPIVIGEIKNKRSKRALNKRSCGAFKMIGKALELVITETWVENMSDEDVEDCADLFKDMDLSKKMQDLIWRKLKLEPLFLAGKLIRSIDISELKSKNLSCTNPWDLETIYHLGKYSDNPDIKYYVTKEISKTMKQPMTVEILVSLGPLICNFPQITPSLLEPSEFFKAAVVLGKNLPCNHSCLSPLSNIAMDEGAFGDPSEWNAQDVSDLGIIVAGLGSDGWTKLVYSMKNSVTGITEKAFRCLPTQYMEDLKDYTNLNTFKSYRRKQDLFKISVDFDFFGPSYHDEVSTNDISGAAHLVGFCLELIIVFILTSLNLY